MASSAAAFADNLVNLGALSIDDHGTIPGTMTQVPHHEQLKVHGKTFALSTLVNMVSGMGITGLVKLGVGAAAVLAVAPATLTGAALACLSGFIAMKAVDIGGELVHDLRLKFDPNYKPKKDHKPRKGGIGKMLVESLPFTKKHDPITKACMAAAIDVAFLVAVEMNVIGATIFLNSGADLLVAAAETAAFAGAVGCTTFGLSATINKISSAKKKELKEGESEKPGWLGIGLKTVSALALAYVAGKIGAENLENVMSMIGTFIPNIEGAAHAAEAVAQSIEQGGMLLEAAAGATAGATLVAVASVPKLLPLGAKPHTVALETANPIVGDAPKGKGADVALEQTITVADPAAPTQLASPPTAPAVRTGRRTRVRRADRPTDGDMAKRGAPRDDLER